MKQLVLLVLIAAAAIILVNVFAPRAQSQGAIGTAVFYTDGKAVPNAHIVIGHISIPAGGGPGTGSPIEEFPVTLTNSATFTSAEAYKCFASKPFGASLTAGGLFRNLDGTHFVFRSSRFGPAWQQDFICIGN